MPARETERGQRRGSRQEQGIRSGWITREQCSGEYSVTVYSCLRNEAGLLINVVVGAVDVCGISVSVSVN